MAYFKEKSFLRSIRRKVLAAFFIGALAFASFWVVTRLGFTGMLQAVKEVSAPNEKLHIVNNLFHQVSQLEQLQKVQALRHPQPNGKGLTREAQHLLKTVDTLRQLSAGSPVQLQQLDSMAAILRSRDKLLKSYLSLRQEFGKNQALSNRINAVSKYIARTKPVVVDSSVITTNKKITTTTVIPTETKARQPFLSRLFGGRKNEPLPPALKYVEEELKVQVDTLSVAKRDSALWQVEKMMRQIEREQHARTTKLLNRELALVKADNQLHQQLLVLLHSLEAEEINLVKQNNQRATEVMNASIGRINTIMVVFLLGVAVLVYFIFLDISRSQKYRRQLVSAKEEAEAAREEAEQLGKVKQRFLANMSHEIRTPLQAIIGFAEQVHQQEQPKRSDLEAIYRSSEHLLQIVNEVLDYSRMVADTFTFEQKPFCMAQLITEVVKTMQVSAENKSLLLQLQADIPENNILVGDAFRLRQILYNLLGNAIKFTQAGRVSLIIRHQVAGEKIHFTFRVEDTGIGMTAAEMENIFNAFEQANSSVLHTHGGTGLGLSIVKTLVESQGGTTAVSSTPGVGSCFTVNLSFAKASAAEAITLPETANVSPGQLPGKVLVVDDDAFILQLCAAILDKYQVENMCTAHAQAVLQEPWDPAVKLVLLDIRMPHLNGLDLCRALRQRIGNDTRIFALTAQALPAEQEAILAQGFDGILMKPFREQELLTLLQQHLTPIKVAPCLAPAITPDTEPDLSMLLKMTGHNEELLEKILQRFVLDTQLDLEDLQEGIETSQPELISETIHRLAGRTGQVGATALAARLRAMETALHQNQPLRELLPELVALRGAVEDLKIKIQDKVGASLVV